MVIRGPSFVFQQVALQHESLSSLTLPASDSATQSFPPSLPLSGVCLEPSLSLLVPLESLVPSAVSVAVVAHVTTGRTMMAGTSAPLGCQVCRHCCPVQGCWSLRHPCSWSGWGCRPCHCCLVPFSCRYCCHWEAGVVYTTSPATTEFFLRCVFILCGRRARIMGSPPPCSLLPPPMYFSIHLQMYRCVDLSGILVCWAEEPL